MSRAPNTLTDLELQIMKIVWDRESSTVRDVYESLVKTRKIAYTTVMTMMRILEQKGHLKKSSRERAYVYRPTKPKKKVVGAMVRDFLDRVFNGSAEPLLVHLVEEGELSKENLQKVSRMLRKSK
jgi:predicted transcriptional regulator